MPHASKKNVLPLFSPSSTCLTNDADTDYRLVESNKKQERGSKAYEEDARLPAYYYIPVQVYIYIYIGAIYWRRLGSIAAPAHADAPVSAVIVRLCLTLTV